MTYWIVYSLVCLVEEVTDVFVSWLPFYYELKVEMHFALGVFIKFQTNPFNIRFLVSM